MDRYFFFVLTHVDSLVCKGLSQILQGARFPRHLKPIVTVCLQVILRPLLFGFVLGVAIITIVGDMVGTVLYCIEYDLLLAWHLILT